MRFRRIGFGLLLSFVTTATTALLERRLSFLITPPNPSILRTYDYFEQQNILAHERECLAALEKWPTTLLSKANRCLNQDVFRLPVGASGHLIGIENAPFFSPSLSCVSPSLLSRKQCARIIAEALQTSSDRWSSRYTYQDLSSDLYCEDLPETRSILDAALPRSVLPAVAHAFPLIISSPQALGTTGSPSLHPASLRVHNAIVVRYDASEQKTRMPSHTDSNTVTVNIALSEPNVDFEGGGTWVQAACPDACRAALASPHGLVADIVATGDNGYSKTLNPKGLGGGAVIRLKSAGDALIQAGRLKHAGAPITSGTRFILTLFLHVCDVVDHPMRYHQRALACLNSGGDAPCPVEALEVAAHQLLAAVAAQGGGGDVEHWSNLATVYRLSGDVRGAVTAGQRAVELGRERGDVSFEAHCNLAADLAQMGCHPHAVAKAFGEALEIAARAGTSGVPREDMAKAHQGLGAALDACRRLEVSGY